MAQSRKVIKDYSAIYLDGLRLDTTALGALTLGGNEVGGGGGVTGSSFANLYVSDGVTAGSLTVGTIEGISASISEYGTITCNHITALTGSSFSNLYVSDNITAGSLSIGTTTGTASISDTGVISGTDIFASGNLNVGTLEGAAASISSMGVVTCVNIIPTYFSPSLSIGTQSGSINSTVGSYNQFGSVLTVSSNLATQGSATFTVENGLINANTKVISNIVNYEGTGLPSVYVSKATTGSFNMTLQNSSITDPLSGTVEIGFMALGLGLG